MAAKLISQHRFMRHRFAQNRFGQHSLFVALAAVTAGNVLFHVLAGRALGAADYGTLSALLTILLGLAIPAGAIQVTLTTKVVRLGRVDREVDHRQLTLVFAGFGLFGAALVVAASPKLGYYLNLRGTTDLYLIGAFFVPTAMGIVYRSVLLGREQYFALSRVLLLGTGLRVGAGVLLFLYRGGITAAIVGTLLSEIVTTVLLARACRRPLAPQAIPWRLTLKASEVIVGSAAFLGLWILLGADTILARHHLDPIDAGAYAATALAARTVLFLPQAAVTAALPSFAGKRQQAVSALMDTLLLCIVLGLTVTVALLGLAQPVGQFVMGFPLDGGVLAILSGAALWLALLTALVNFHLAQGSIRVAMRVWVGLPFLLFFAAQASTSPRGLALVVLTSGAIATLAITLPLLKLDRERLGIRGPGPGAALSPGNSLPLSLSIVVPFRNEGPSTAQLIRSLLRELDVSGRTGTEIVAVSDGSSDDGPGLVAAIADPRIVLVTNSPSRGKGSALRTGMSLARGDRIAMIDGDGDIAAGNLLPMVTELDLYQADAVLGSKRHPGSSGTQTLARRLLSLASRLAARLLLNSPIPDSQTGIKVFRRELIVDALPRTQENGYLFDLELLLAARARGFDHLIESPVAILSSSVLSSSALLGPAASKSPSSVGVTAILESAFTLVRMIGRFGGLGPSQPDVAGRSEHSARPETSVNSSRPIHRSEAVSV